MAKKKLTFEDGMQELEEIVRNLEQGQMPLEESFKAFERAVSLQKALQELLAKLWGYDFYGDERVVDSHIKNLRHKLGRNYIDTVRGVGYRAAKEDH